MRRTLTGLAATAALGALSLVAAPATPATAAGHEQIVFSGEAEGTGGEIEFWIWCAVDPAGAYDDCAGSVRFPDDQLVRHVEGEAAEVGDDAYQLDVASTRDGSVACSLTNTPPITHGRSNQVDVVCTSPSLTASGDDVVITNGG